MSGWSAFYSVAAGTSATLLGLLFVAVSVAAPRALSDRHSLIHNLAEQSFQNYLLVLVLSCLMLFPDMEAATAGRVALALVASRTVWAVLRLWAILAYAATWRARLRVVRRQLMSLCGLACLLIASIALAASSAEVFHLLAAGTLVLLASSAVGSWELLLQLVKGRTGSADEGQD